MHDVRKRWSHRARVLLVTSFVVAEFYRSSRISLSSSFIPTNSNHAAPGASVTNSKDVMDVPMTATATECGGRVLDQLDKRFDLQRSARQTAMKTSMGYLSFGIGEPSFDLFEPEATCFSEERFGSKIRYAAYGDGPKFICGVDFIARQKANGGKKCLVYVIGSNNKIEFEKAVHTYMDCEIHTFDPTLKEAFIGGDYATFHPLGLGKDGAVRMGRGKTWAVKSFERIIKELGHENRTIDVIQMDCGGCEYDAMPPLFELIAAGRVQVNQVLIELHLEGTTVEEHLKDFFSSADKAKMRVFHKERNGWECEGKFCVEYALASVSFLREVNRDAICRSHSEEESTPTNIYNTMLSNNSLESECVERALDRLDERYAFKRSARQVAMNTSLGSNLSFDIYEPEATCFIEERFGSELRYSAYGDGPKFICGVDFIARQKANDGKKCLVYSIGSSNKIEFEKAVHTYMDCEIHTFDPTLKEAFIGGDYATFHPLGLGKDGAVQGRGKTWTGKSFETIMKELGHENRTIDVIKIDCEGCEYSTMPPLFELIAAGKVQVNQVLIELHLEVATVEHLKDFFLSADKAKMRVFHKERNGWGCKGRRCVEYALSSESFLREANRDAICPSH